MLSQEKRSSTVPPTAVVRAVNNAQRALVRFTRRLTPARYALLDLVTSRWISDAIIVAARLGVPEALEAGAKPIGEIARTVGANEQALYRVMRALARERVFEERDGRVFALTDLSRPLLRSDPKSMRNLVGMVGASWLQQVWARLEDSVRTGSEVFTTVHGKNLWTYLAEHPEDGTEFHKAMAETSRDVGEAVASCYDFSQFESIVDIGGGAGQLISAILKQHPRVRGAVFDMKQPLAHAPEMFRKHGVQDRAEMIEGNLLESVPKGKDAYIMKSIIHGRSDEVSRDLLARCRDAMRPGGKVIVGENVVPDGDGPYLQFFDLQMLILSHGRMRTLAEYESLFNAAGLRLERVVGTPGPLSLLVGARA